MKILFSMLFFFLIHFHLQSSSDRILSLQGLKILDVEQYSVYIPISKDSQPTQLFYWLVKNSQHKSNTPIVLWLNGGPGASSLYGFFMENGPYEIKNNGVLIPRKYSLHHFVDYLAIDQPAGVGLSVGNKQSYRNESDAMNQLYYALKVFIQRYPDYAHRQWYVAGESYAAKYIPQLAIRILEDKQIDLKGILLGDPWISPKLQQKANIDYAYCHGLIDDKDRQVVAELYAKCAQAIDAAFPSSRKANQVCGKIQEFIAAKSGGLNLGNISTGKEKNDQFLVHYLDRKDVRRAIHVSPEAKSFSTFDALASDILEVGEQDSVTDLLQKILNSGVKVLIYNGLEDGKDSNFLSTILLLQELSWHGKEQFLASSTCVWREKNDVAGYVKSSHSLMQVKVRGAGHLAPIDQPYRIWSLFQKFIENKPLC